MYRHVRTAQSLGWVVGLCHAWRLALSELRRKDEAGIERRMKPTRLERH